ncbi:glycoside hydrolase family 30 protein [Hymenobacter metallilatus]|uniref:Glucosylceramidase n=1 Tax=Hymenobacter metallilatus TaxID=2493666 RepID=A0A3R9M0X6_9BACT|nr:glycoside hydrolase family 30 beta sandwich domain-containing protein [Hymenobacter metallilatus]RSK33213.1 glucosylceramidase [Hymenobacter metallilatus]
MTVSFTTSLGVAGLLALSLLAGCGGSDKPDPQPQPPTPPPSVTPSQVQLWLTTTDPSTRFAKSTASLTFVSATSQNTAIFVDTTQTYQTIDGFGYALTGGSAQLLYQMGATERAALLRELFATDGTNIGTSYLRVSIGASDLDATVFTYDDAGPDPTLANFSLAPDRRHLIPVLKEILAINPTIKILGSPWTAPLWMKTNNNSVGGSLRPEYYDAYARYFVKYIQGMKAEGITIDAVTLQNEPLYGGNNPSMLMTAAEQANFIRDNVGPALRAAGLTTKIILYDHNLDVPEYPLSVLRDPLASQYVDGSAFHLYGGSISTMSTVRNAFPGKNVYFTEMWTGGPGNFNADFKWHMDNLIIGATRNWSRNVLEWNLAADQNYGPHTPGGCTTCLGAITINGNTVTRNSAYYTVAHAAKFVRPGSVRINTNVPGNLQNVAFKNPDGRKVLLVLNTGSTSQTFDIQYRGKAVTTTLDAGSAGTYVW